MEGFHRNMIRLASRFKGSFDYQDELRLRKKRNLECGCEEFEKLLKIMKITKHEIWIQRKAKVV